MDDTLQSRHPYARPWDPSVELRRFRPTKPRESTLNGGQTVDRNRRTFLSFLHSYYSTNIRSHLPGEKIKQPGRSPSNRTHRTFDEQGRMETRTNAYKTRGNAWKANIRAKTNVKTKAKANTQLEEGMNTSWAQKKVRLPAYPRGCHVITRHLVQQVDEIRDYEVGLANLFIMHTSASLTINENASPDVPLDMEDALNRIVPEGKMYRHLDEGLDDMPAHVKSSLMGCSLTVPISAGKLCLGTWQGIYLNEHRDYGGARTVVVTLQGQKRNDGRKYGV